MEYTPKYEYSENKRLPIIACLHEEPVKLEELLKGSKGIDFVNMDMSPEQKEEGFIGEFRENLWAYIISPIDSSDKFSLKYAECTGMVVVGTDKETGENISFLSHQNPNFFLLYDDLNFFTELKKKVQEIKDRCEPDSFDAIMFGGKFANVKDFPDGHAIHEIDKEMYLKSIESVSGTINSILGFNPEIISGPKFNPAYDHVVFRNNDRRLHLFRFSKESDFIRNFNPDEVRELSKGWKPGQWALPDLGKNKNL